MSTHGHHRAADTPGMIMIRIKNHTKILAASNNASDAGGRSLLLENTRVMRLFPFLFSQNN
jgi:hypothetical protein